MQRFGEWVSRNDAMWEELEDNVGRISPALVLAFALTQQVCRPPVYRHPRFFLASFAACYFYPHMRFVVLVIAFRNLAFLM